MDHLSLSDPQVFRRGFDHVRSNDERLGRVLERRGVIKFEAGGDLFESLVESILSQQLAGAAADAIIGRVRAIYPDGKLVPRLMSSTPPRKLTAAGVSPQKLTYLKDLSSRVARSRVDLEALRDASDEEVIRVLDEVKGIGPWTVQMLLIFAMGRPDVLPVDDLGVKKGVQRVYSMNELPRKKDIERLAEKWHPFCTVASLYLWRSKAYAGT